MKHTLIKQIAVICVLSIGPYASGMSVFDAANMSQHIQSRIERLKEYAIEANRWIQTLSQYKKTIDHYDAEIKNTTGVSEITSLIKNAEGLYDEVIRLKENSLQFALMLKNDLNSERLIQNGKELSSKFLFNDYCSNYGSKNTQSICYKQIESVFKDNEALDKISDDFLKTLKEIEKLSSKALKTKTMKEAADAQIALQLAQAKLKIQEQQITLIKERQQRSIQANELLKENARVDYVKSQYSKENLKLHKQYMLNSVSFE